MERSFIFKHALVRDAAYESLLLVRRREWHGRIAPCARSSTFGDIAANEPDLLAHHFGEAGLLVPACDYRMRAGDQAVSRSAYPEAIAHFTAGLKLAEACRRRTAAPATGFPAQARRGSRWSSRPAERRGAEDGL